jgi:hypothetical protein
MAVAKARGVLLGRHTELAPAIEAQIIDLRTTGLPFQAIADRLNETGVVTARGAKWNKAYVSAVVKRNGDPITRSAGRPRKVAA